MTQDVETELEVQLKELQSKIKKLEELQNDPDLSALAKDEIKMLKQQLGAVEQSLKAIRGEFQNQAEGSGQKFNPNQATLEIRQGAGGEEAKIWAEDLFRMYSRYAESKNWKLDHLDSGYYKIVGKNVYPRLKFESGVHRVQRVPDTESQGRIHTSTASVAVLPIISQTQLEIRDEDLDWQFVKSGGAGGQNVNKVNSAVRLTHIPSGITVNCSRERTQIRNREIALEMLRSQLWEIEEEKRLGSIEAQRTAAVGRAMRAEKIRTYNYPQNRVTDHRINQSWHSLDKILEGDLDDILTTVSDKLSGEADSEDS